jgi:hypothetical protein
MIMKYVKACVTMRVNGVLTWLMVDQVGSTSVTSNITRGTGGHGQVQRISGLCTPERLLREGLEKCEWVGRRQTTCTRVTLALSGSARGDGQQSPYQVYKAECRNHQPHSLRSAVHKP